MWTLFFSLINPFSYCQYFIFTRNAKTLCVSKWPVRKVITFITDISPDKGFHKPVKDKAYIIQSLLQDDKLYLKEYALPTLFQLVFGFVWMNVCIHWFSNVHICCGSRVEARGQTTFGNEFSLSILGWRHWSQLRNLTDHSFLFHIIFSEDI